ncbi:antibiotic biosynthesis monooxygenase [Kribbella sp. NPDC050124]|uniref:antibiotic biosynthesis monooxygenase n=1 Tax=Kribbella sp. NPDC050124 TaxID=3364114 RepID=UPI0037A7EB4E
MTRRVKPGHESFYEQFLTGIIAAASRYPGHLGAEVFRPENTSTGEYRVVYRFDTAEHLRAWLDSDEHAAWLERAEPHVIGPIHRQFLTGLETWFTVPSRPGTPPPPPYKIRAQHCTSGSYLSRSRNRRWGRPRTQPSDDVRNPAPGRAWWTSAIHTVEGSKGTTLMYVSYFTIKAIHEQTHSALPNAPVLPHAPQRPRRHPLRAVRRVLRPTTPPSPATDPCPRT